MRILYSMIRPGYLRNFEGTLRRLSTQGHRIHLVFALKPKLGEERLMKALAKDCPGITYGEHEKLKGGAWRGLARMLRSFVDFLRYLDPRYDKAIRLRERAQSRVSAFLVWFSRLPFVRTPTGIRTLTRFLLVLEQAIPVDPVIDHAVAAFKPDLVLITPLVDLGSYQVDFVKSARARGIPSALWVASWDNLTNKGLIRLIPDNVAVWNEMQKREAIELHGVPEDQVVVTGATAFDHWFEWKSAGSREDFCRRVGLDASRPYVLYLCSSPFIAPREVEFVKRWIEGLRSCRDAMLAEAGVLVRPHPQNVAQWAGIDLSEYPNVVVFPRDGENPIDSATKSNYFESMHHCAAVVGLNTSALIETGIVGRAVFTLVPHEFQSTTEGTLHFHHLVGVNGGLLHVAKDFDEHYAQLATALRQENGAAEKSRRFVEAFVRPRGLKVPAAQLLAESAESLVRVRPAPAAPPPGARVIRAVLWPAAASLEGRRRFRFWLKRHGFLTGGDKGLPRPWDPDKEDRSESRMPATEGVGEDR